MGQISEPNKHSSRYPNLTRKQLRKYSLNLASLHLPKELEDYLLDIYNEEDFYDTEGYIRNYSEEDIYYGVKKSIMEYAQIKKQMDDILYTSEYLGNRSLTIKVKNEKPEFLKWSETSEPQIVINESCDYIPF